MSETGVFCVFCSCPDTEMANNLARELVNNHLAACASVMPGVTSFYHWEDQLEQDNEALIIIKCAEHAWEALRDHVLSRHPYENPELIAIPVEHGSGAYMDWVINACAPPKDDRH